MGSQKLSVRSIHHGPVSIWTWAIFPTMLTSKSRCAPFATNVHFWAKLEEVRKHGVKLVVIDPRRTRSARAADWHIPIRIGTDAALALGIMHVLARDNLCDRNYIASHTLGFDRVERLESPQAASLLYKLINVRGERSTALVTNIDFENWGEYLGDPPLAMAFLDRIVDGAIIVKINGKSYRAHRARPAPPANGDQTGGRPRNGQGR